MSRDGVQAFEETHVPDADGIVPSACCDLIPGKNSVRKMLWVRVTYPFGEKAIVKMA